MSEPLAPGYTPLSLVVCLRSLLATFRPWRLGFPVSGLAGGCGFAQQSARLCLDGGTAVFESVEQADPDAGAQTRSGSREIVKRMQCGGLDVGTGVVQHGEERVRGFAERRLAGVESGHDLDEVTVDIRPVRSCEGSIEQ